MSSAHDKPNTVILNGHWMRLHKVLLATYPVVLTALLGVMGWFYLTVDDMRQRVAVLESQMPANLKERLTVVETAAGDPKQWTGLVESIHNSEEAWKRIERRLEKLP